ATPPSHTYVTADTYTITISGTFPRIFLWNSTSAGQIRSVKQWGDIAWGSMSYAFRDCSNLSIANEAGVPNLSNVTNMFGMFQNSSLSGDLSKWDVSKVTNMFGMFANSSFNGDISEWDVSKVTSMGVMFWASTFNGDISEWNVSKVTNMAEMFFQSDFNGDISDWDVSKVTNMESMFQSSDFNGDLSKWDVSKVTNMANMFTGNTSMSSENYDKLLIGWSTLNTAARETKIPSGIAFDAPDKYSCRGKAGRDKLTGATHSWTIKGDELISIRTDAASLPEVTSQCEGTDLTPPTAKSSCTVGEGTT
ncbi:MAG: DUF285 domain-containing protein, partial [Ekhidna sp.]|nr:DUF285 domain-containing protein [Ekhidna sp.]